MNLWIQARGGFWVELLMRRMGPRHCFELVSSGSPGVGGRRTAWQYMPGVVRYPPAQLRCCCWKHVGLDFAEDMNGAKTSHKFELSVFSQHVGYFERRKKQGSVQSLRVSIPTSADNFSIARPDSPALTSKSGTRKAVTI